MFHGQHLKETRGNSRTPPEKPQKPMHPNTDIPKKKKKSSPLHPYKIRNTPPRHIAQNKHSPECSHWFMQMQTLAGRSVHPKSHTKRANENTQHTVGSCYTLFIVTVTLGSSAFFFLGGGTFLTLPLSVLCLLLPILSFLWGWGCFFRDAPGASARWG